MNNSRPIFITLTADLAQELIEQMQAVLDGEASYFHAELWTDDGREVAIHLSGPDDVDDGLDDGLDDEGGAYYE